MWKKTDEETSPPPSQPASTGAAQPAPAAPPRRASASTGGAAIGPSIQIQGDLTGDEDLTIHGRVDGTVRLEEHHVGVGPDGRMKGDIHGRAIHVEGDVRGNLYGSEEVILRSSGRVQGNIAAPRVTLENGSHFKGAIDMEAHDARKAEEPKTAVKPAPTPRPTDSPAAGAEASTPKEPEVKEASAKEPEGGGTSKPSPHAATAR